MLFLVIVVYGVLGIGESVLYIGFCGIFLRFLGDRGSYYRCLVRWEIKFREMKEVVGRDLGRS